MARIEWDLGVDRIYQVGLDRGVLYLRDQAGVPWNGLTSFEDNTPQSSESYFFDGQKIIDYPFVGDFTGKLKAVTYPDEFAQFDGLQEVEDGVFVGNQNRNEFGLSFRTLIGDGDVGLDLGYKIHIFYNLTAQAETVSRDTIDSNVDLIEFGWSITSRPEKLSQFVPTAYISVDTRDMVDPVALANLESILYGSEASDAWLPSLPVLLEILEESYTIVIIDNGNGTWTAQGPSDLITLTDPTTFEITDVDATYLDADTYEVEST